MAKLIIFGTGDIAKLAHFYFSTDSSFDVAAFTVDRSHLADAMFCGLPVVPFDEVTTAYPPGEYFMFVALSYARVNAFRAEKYAEAKQLGYRLASYVSSRCTWLAATPPGDNCFVLEDNTVQPFVTIGCDVTLWSGNHIGHDSVIGDHCFVASHVVVSGHVHVAARCFLGVNATLRNGITVGARSVIGASATVMEDVAEDSVLVSRPATKLPARSDSISL